MRRGREANSKIGLGGNVGVRLLDKDGRVKHEEWGENLVTDDGDQHFIERLTGTQATEILGMKLGTGATAASKGATGNVLGSYISGSYEALDSAATESDKGSGSGYRAQYVCTWIAGDVTNSAIAEVILTIDATDATSSAANTIARYVFAATIDKQAGDSLEVTWNLDVLGA